jgi:hypothetical protein
MYKFWFKKINEMNRGKFDLLDDLESKNKLEAKFKLWNNSITLEHWSNHRTKNSRVFRT